MGPWGRVSAGREVLLALITWHAGGLEVAIVLHAVLNGFSFIAAAF